MQNRLLDSVDHMNFEMAGYIDDIKEKGVYHQGYPVLGNTIDCIEILKRLFIL